MLKCYMAKMREVYKEVYVLCLVLCSTAEAANTLTTKLDDQVWEPLQQNTFRVWYKETFVT